ncbi:envelope protein UL43 [Chimpanzee herpesvirus strain 105640]|uniref:Envelope protein UL43 n=1 Tax=Chimpanzee herpesvirus strain 105640 TaxID=332937 RepID=K9MG43_9ALPH|nr:envelope protein UL43 [Chimpanzee herpesvirus strain 105640]AFV26932.1 envelope protein UL43 [Chimpanzee herpesvirus strain 105640]
MCRGDGPGVAGVSVETCTGGDNGDDGRPRLACVGAIARGVVHIWFQATTLGFVGSVVLSCGPYADAMSGAFVIGSTGLGFLRAPPAFARPPTRVCAWLRLVGGGAALALWSLGEAGAPPGVPGPATQCLALGAAYAALLVLADDVHPLFLLAPRPLFVGTLGVVVGGLTIGGSARYWWIDPPASAALTAAVVAGLGATAARDSFSKACPRHRRFCVVCTVESPQPRYAPDDTERPADHGPLLPSTHHRRYQRACGDGAVRPENVWVPVVTFAGAVALAACAAREHVRGTMRGPVLPLWPQVFVGGHAAAGLTELCQTLAPRDLTDPLLFVYIGFQVVNHGLMFVVPDVAVYAMLGGAVWISLTQVLGLRRRLHKDPEAGPWAAATLRGLFFSVYALGFAVGVLGQPQMAASRRLG